MYAAPNTGVRTIEEVEKAAIISALEFHNGTVIAAAKSLGIGRQTLYNKMKLYGIVYP